jgi:hypothetical protein
MKQIGTAIVFFATVGAASVQWEIDAGVSCAALGWWLAAWINY